MQKCVGAMCGWVGMKTWNTGNTKYRKYNNKIMNLHSGWDCLISAHEFFSREDDQKHDKKM